MHQLSLVLATMRPTTSDAADFISMRLIKEAGPSVKPLLLHITDQIIKTEHYPSTLKLTKIFPIRKTSKPENIPVGWRPINIVPLISKIVEKCLLNQITQYLEKQNLINHTHHGSVKLKGTQTLVSELYDSLLETLENDEEVVVIQTD